MTRDDLSEQLTRMTERVALLREDAARSNTPLLDRALAEVSTSIEEMQVAEEELHEQNERLVAVNAELELERRRYAELFDQAPVGYVVTDPAGVLLEVNNAASMLLESDRATLVGKPFAVLIDTSDRERWTTMLLRLREGARCDSEVLLLRTGGPSSNARLQCRISGTANVDEKGSPRLCRWVLENFEAFELVAAAKQMALEARHKDEFLAMLGHELRNPLAPIRAAVELWRSNEGRLTDQQRQWTVDVVSRQTDHLAHLVDDLLDVSRVTHGKIHLRHAVVDIREVIEQARDVVRAQSQLHRVELDLPEDPIRVHGDPVRLRQVIVNLLDNAVKFTPRGNGIAVRANVVGSSVAITVIDEGIGIAPELIESLFAPFSQAEQPLARQQGGLGLGLALVRQLVELHGGSVEAMSAGLGKGSTFVVLLPLTQDDARPVAERRDPALLGPGKLQLLVVDDNVDAAQMMAHLLESAGHRVALAYDGASAIECVVRMQPDAVLLDLGLPDIDGLEVARHLRVVAPDVRLVALTGYGDSQMRARVRDCGFADHLLKPVERDTLRRALDGIPRRAR